MPRPSLYPDHCELLGSVPALVQHGVPLWPFYSDPAPPILSYLLLLSSTIPLLSRFGACCVRSDSAPSTPHTPVCAREYVPVTPHCPPTYALTCPVAPRLRSSITRKCNWKPSDVSPARTVASSVYFPEPCRLQHMAPCSPLQARRTQLLSLDCPPLYFLHVRFYAQQFECELMPWAASVTSLERCLLRQII